MKDEKWLGYLEYSLVVSWGAGTSSSGLTYFRTNDKGYTTERTCDITRMDNGDKYNVCVWKNNVNDSSIYIIAYIYIYISSLSLFL